MLIRRCVVFVSTGKYCDHKVDRFSAITAIWWLGLIISCSNDPSFLDGKTSTCF